MDAHELIETNKLLHAAQLLRLSEAGFARDNHGRITEEVDPNGEKLDWYSLGLVDALCVSRGYDTGQLRLLLYLILICETGPGETALQSTERLIERLNQQGPARYIDAGRRTVRDLLTGERTNPGSYGELLATDLAEAAH